MRQRRAGAPRIHKTLNPSARVLIDSVVTAHRGGGAGLPASLLATLRGARSDPTWNQYSATLQPWFTHAKDHDFPPLPADPMHFACWLASVGERNPGYTPTKLRCVAVRAFSDLAGVPSPHDHPLVMAYRACVRRCRGGRGRGKARPLLRAEIPTTPRSPQGTPPASRRGRRAGPSPGTRQRALSAATAHMRLLHEGCLRYDDTREGQLGDVLIYPDTVELSVFGTKTDHRLTGQVCQMPGSASASETSGVSALLEGTRRGLQRLAALPAEVFSVLADRLARSFPNDRAVPSAMATWPACVRDEALPLYDRGLLVHCLPYYGTWLWAPLTVDSDLSQTLTTSQFVSQAKIALAAAGIDTSRFGAHSLRRGGAAELTHGGASGAVLRRALRHTSEKSSEPYVFQSVLLSATAAAMRAATHPSKGVEPPPASGSLSVGLKPTASPLEAGAGPSRGYAPSLPPPLPCAAAAPAAALAISPSQHNGIGSGYPTPRPAPSGWRGRGVPSPTALRRALLARSGPIRGRGGSPTLRGHPGITKAMPIADMDGK